EWRRTHSSRVSRPSRTNVSMAGTSVSRPTNPEMASTGMEGFQEFMVNPDRLQTIRERLDEERKSVFE
ncbi:MAG: hypothetical protein ACOC2N_07245, partial [Spirochaetota bacterium]